MPDLFRGPAALRVDEKGTLARRGSRQKPGRNANPPEDREAVMQEIHELQLRNLELLERMG